MIEQTTDEEVLVDEAEASAPQEDVGVVVVKAVPLTPEQRQARQKTIKEHWAEHAVTSGLDGPPVDTQLKGPTRKK